MDFDLSQVDFFSVVLILLFCVTAYVVSGRKGLALYSILIPLTAAFVGELGINYKLLALIGTSGALFCLKEGEMMGCVVLCLSFVTIYVLTFMSTYYYYNATTGLDSDSLLYSVVVTFIFSALIFVLTLAGLLVGGWCLGRLRDMGAFILMPLIVFVSLLPSYPFFSISVNYLPADLLHFTLAVFFAAYSYTIWHSSLMWESDAKCERFENKFLAVASVSALLLRYNGGYTEKAKDLFRKFFSDNSAEEKLNELDEKDILRSVEKRLLSQMNIKNLSYKKCCKEVRDNVSQAERAKVVQLLFDIAVIDGVIYPEERNLLRQIMEHLLISEEQAQVLTNMYSRYFYESRTSYARSQGTYTSSCSYVPSRLVEAYAKLGLKPGTCLDEVKRAYRRLVFENHPDRFVNASESTRAAAEERTRELNRAIETIEKFAS